MSATFMSSDSERGIAPYKLDFFFSITKILKVIIKTFFTYFLALPAVILTLCYAVSVYFTGLPICTALKPLSDSFQI